MRSFCYALLAAVFMPASAIAAEVVASIKPVHSLVAAVMAGDGEPALLVQGSASPHTFVLKPSQRSQIANAKIIFYISDNMEMFLRKLHQKNDNRWVAMDQAPGLVRYPARTSGMWDAHEHEHDHDHEHEHEHERGAGAMDPHIWLSAANAIAMTDHIVTQLTKRYPNKRDLYAANGAVLKQKLGLMDESLKARMKPFGGKPFVVFHDAYQYFEKSYGLFALGAITLHPERGPNAGHLRDIHRKLKETGARCVFFEPSFDMKTVEGMLEGTQAKSIQLDPEGLLLESGPDLYVELMEQVARGLEACFAH